MRGRLGWVLLAIVFILLMQFFVRAHHPLHLPFFIDEHRHISRAEAAFDGHPARESMGKFLLYIWLWPFQDGRLNALIISRWAVALFSLIGSAAVFALSRKLFGVTAGLLAMIFYAFLPLALFYERMVLADGFAGCFGALVAWQSMVLAEHPSRKRAAIVGLLIGLAIMAKLTLTFIAVMPVLAVVCLGRYRNLADAFRRYMPYLTLVGFACIVSWLPVLIPAAIAGAQGNYYVLVDQSLADTSLLNESDTNRFTYLWEQIGLMVWEPMLILIILLVIVGLWRHPPKFVYGLGWLVATWTPGILLVWRTRTRYLSPGAFALALLVGGGLVTMQELLRQDQDRRLRWARIALPVSVIGIWFVAFALPFTHLSMTDAVQLRLPVPDENDYFRGPQSAYTLQTMLDDLVMYRDAQPAQVKGIFTLCPRFNIYFRYRQLNLDCTHQRFPKPDQTAEYTVLKEAVADYAVDHVPFFLVVEAYRDKPFELDGLVMVPFREYERPHRGTWVTVWRVCEAGDAFCSGVGQ